MLKHFKREESITLVVLVFIAALSFLLDSGAFYSLDSIKNVALDSFASFINNPITLSVIFIVIIVNLLVHNKHQALKNLIIAVISSTIIANILKLFFARPRPFGLEKSIPILDLPDYSFPSGHSFIIFSMIPILNDRYPKMKVFFFVLAILIVLGRVYLGLHHLSDIAAGAALGYLTGLIVLRYKWGKA